MLKRIKSKLKSKSGLTLTEMLITVILLMFFSSACLLGISTALSTRTSMIKAADSDILCSTVTQYISNELRLSLNGTIEGGGGVFKYDGGSTYAGLTCGNSVIKLDADGRLIRSIGEVSNRSINSEYSVLNDSAYSGFKLSKLEFNIIGDTITCSFEIKDGETTVKTKEQTKFTVTPITPIATPGSP